MLTLSLLRLKESHVTKNIVIIGAGIMAESYANVLKAMDICPSIIGRSENSSSAFQEKTGLKTLSGGVAKAFHSLPVKPDYAIVAVTIEELSGVTKQLIESGVKYILCEKPVGIDLKEIQEVRELAQKSGTKVYVAYNRRFYSSVLKAMELLKEDGGISSLHFDFTEWESHINLPRFSEPVRKNWILANSSHVIDMAFFMMGKPQTLHAYSKENVYTGSGISEKGIPFTYHSNWNSGGRWGVEVMSPKFKYFFRPLEKLQMQAKLSMEIKELPQDELDQKFKPGLYKQVESFLGSKACLLELEDYALESQLIEKMKSGC